LTYLKDHKCPTFGLYWKNAEKSDIEEDHLLWNKNVYLSLLKWYGWDN
jgi:hypothetical protein